MIKPNTFSFLKGGGEMGQLIRDYDWANTSIGSPENWSPTLRTTLMIMLNSRFPMFLFWGDELICFYNDAYQPSLGETGRHPWTLGKTAKEAFEKTWHELHPFLLQVIQTGNASWREDQLATSFRNGYRQDAYWTFSHSPVYNENEVVTGVLVTCIETTAHVNNMAALHQINNELEFALEAAELGTYDYNPITNKFSANSRLKNWFGLDKEDEVDLPIAINAIAANDRERVSQLISNALLYENGGRYDTEYTIENPVTGQKIIVKAKGKTSFDKNNKAYRLNGTVEDITEEVYARRKIEESEQYFRQLTESVPAIIWITNPNGYCDYLNRNWYDFTGQNREEAEGMGWLDATHPNDKERTADIFLLANEKRESFTAVYQLKHKDGNYRWVVDTGIPRFAEDGTYEGMVGTVVDIHEQKVAEERIRLSEERFRNLIAAAPVAIGLFMGRDLVIETPNQTFIDIVGKGWGVVGKPLREAMPELLTEGQPFLKILDDVYTSGKMFQTTGTQVKIVQNGVLTYNYYDFSYTPLLDDEGKTYAILDIAIDVTDQVISRRKLEIEEERTRLAVEASELGMYEVDLVTHRVDASSRFNEIFDVLNSDEHVSYINTVHPEDMPVRERAHQIAMQTGTLSYEARVMKNSGAVHWIRVKGKVNFDVDNKPVKILGVVQDVTDQKEMERQKDSFLGIASHELKTPVTSVKGYAQFLERKFRRQGDDSSADLLLKMNGQVNRLSNLIGDLLDVTKINNGRIQFSNIPFDFNQMVEEVIEDMQRTSDKHAIKKQLNFKRVINSDRERIYQVVVNLISNAIKYSPDHNQIIVYTEDHGNEMQLCVQDFGIGISRDKKDLVFEQFYRVSGTKEHTFPGLGLGLYISSEIVKRMNGRIWVNSVEGKGSTFCFAIPV